MTEAEPGVVVRALYGFYRRVVSPVLHTLSPSRCVYLPTCSEYAFVAVVRFGLWKGSWLALRRVARCHPFAKGGLDPVPAPVPDPVTEPASGGDREGSSSVSIHTDRLS